MDLVDQIKATNAYGCLECGKCTAVCPVSLFSQRYSPRSMLTKTVRNEFDSLYIDYDLWSCLTCRRCDAVCPANIDYSTLTQVVRSSAKDSGFHGKCSHSGAMELLQRVMTAKDIKQNRLEWVTDDLKITDQGDILYYVGCAPYFDVFFDDLNISTIDAAKSSIKILNKLGVTPVLMSDERCCGHDLLWNGDIENFKMLAEKNIESIENTSAKTILFSCAECMSAFMNLYPEHGFKVKPKLMHMSQFLAEKMSANKLNLKESATDITFQDPCRLGRHMGIYDEPRQVLKQNDGEHYHEMMQHEKKSLCCG
ncbi:MAG: (Fe-S)-binding protein, partial [Candidatus Marinimicrobia bacterium]|nr:(Fe-S)-binding protein [Candidatus Neomarinimicrobiota bacterium]